MSQTYTIELKCNNCYYRSEYSVNRGVMLNGISTAITCVNCGNVGNTITLFLKYDQVEKKWVFDT